MRGRANVHGRTAAIRVVTFRVSAEERTALEADATAAGVSVGALARLRTLGACACSMSTSRVATGTGGGASVESRRVGPAPRLGAPECPDEPSPAVTP